MDNLPDELRKYIFSFLRKKERDQCLLCQSWYKTNDIYRFAGFESYTVCKRCWIGY